MLLPKRTPIKVKDLIDHHLASMRRFTEIKGEHFINVVENFIQTPQSIKFLAEANNNYAILEHHIRQHIITTWPESIKDDVPVTFKVFLDNGLCILINLIVPTQVYVRVQKDLSCSFPAKPFKNQPENPLSILASSASMLPPNSQDTKNRLNEVLKRREARFNTNPKGPMEKRYERIIESGGKLPEWRDIEMIEARIILPMLVQRYLKINNVPEDNNISKELYARLTAFHDAYFSGLKERFDLLKNLVFETRSGWSYTLKHLDAILKNWEDIVKK